LTSLACCVRFPVCPLPRRSRAACSLLPPGNRRIAVISRAPRAIKCCIKTTRPDSALPAFVSPSAHLRRRHKNTRRTCGLCWMPRKGWERARRREGRRIEINSRVSLVASSIRTAPRSNPGIGARSAEVNSHFPRLRIYEVRDSYLFFVPIRESLRSKYKELC